MAVVMSDSNRQRVRVALVLTSSPPRMPLEVIIPAPLWHPPSEEIPWNFLPEPDI